MNLYADFKLLDETLVSLSGKDEELRKKAAADIKAHVESAARELSLERFARFENELYQNVFSFVNGNTLGEKVGGILAIRELIGCTSASAEAKVIRFAKALSTALNNCNDFALTELIADAFGHMARNSPVSHVEYLEGELHRALDWLKSKTNQSVVKRFAACTILQQLAKNAPTIFFARIHEFFDLIWGPIWDVKERIRFAAGKTLSACLAVLRERTYHLQWYCYLYDQFMEGFHNGCEEYVHGSLLVVNEMLKYTGDFMIPRFKEVCKSIMSLKDHKSRLVRSGIISLLPSLAFLAPDAFARSHLDETVEFLQKCSRSTELRPQVLLSTGRLSVAVGPHLVTRIGQLMVIIKDSFVLQKKGAKNTEVSPEALQCISDMVQGLGAPFHERVLSLLEPMLQSGLTAELIDTLSIISTHMPNQRPMVQIRLLEEATKVLGGDVKPQLEEPDFVYSWAKRGIRLPKNINQQIAAMNSSDGTGAVYSGVDGISAGLGGMSVGGGGGVVGAGSIQQYPSTASLSAMGSGSLHMPHSVSSINVGAGVSGGINITAKGVRPGSVPRNASLASGIATPPPSSGRSSGSGIKKFISGWKGTSSSSNVKATPGSAGVGVAALGLSADFEDVATPVVHTRVQSPNELILLSLRTLASLSIPTFSLIPLVQYSVLPYFISDDYRIRREAATTCAKMIIAAMVPPRTRGPSANAIEEIISRLLEVVVADISSHVRLAVLRSLSSEFDKYLARSHHIDTILLLLADEMFDIKMEALSILGRLALANPAVVLPPIRLQLIRIVSEMTSCPEFRAIEEATLMLCNFLRYPVFHSMVKPFMSTLIATLPLKSDLRTTTAALEAMGELCIVLQHEMLPYVDPLLSIIITNMLDQSSYKKQEVAVKTLGQLVSSTGLVVRPYLQYPQLLPKALDMLFRNNNANRPASLRNEVLRTLGLLGALDPARYDMITACLKNHEKVKREQDDAKQTSEAGRKGSGGGGGGANILDSSLLIINSVPESRINRDALERAGTTGLQSGRERADSNISLSGLDKAQTGQIGGGGSRDNLANKSNFDDRQQQTERLNNNKQQTEDLVRSEVLLEGDSADAPAHLFMFEQSFMRSLAEPPHNNDVRHTPSSEDYYPRIAIAALVRMLRDQSLNVHHSSATQTIIQIFRSLGPKCVPFLDQIVPYFLQIVRRSSAGLRESILQQLSQLVSITEHNITPFLPNIIEILRDYWHEHLEYVLAIVRQVAITTADSFNTHLPAILPLLLSSLTIPRGMTVHSFKIDSSVLKPVEQTLACCRSLRVALRPYIHLFVPAVCKLISSLQELSQETLATQVKAIVTLKRLCASSKGAVVEQCHVVASIIVHTMTRTILKASQMNLPPHATIFTECLSTLCTLAQQIGHRILPFDNLIMRSIEGRGLETSSYRDISSAIRSGYWDENAERNDGTDWYGDGGMTVNQGGTEGSMGSMRPALERSESDLVGMSTSLSNERLNNVPGSMDTFTPTGGSVPAKLVLNQQHLQRAWDVSQRSTSNDWTEWLWRFKVELLRESPVPTLRACSALAQAHPPMAKELFHAAFVSCWHDLTEQYQDHLVRSLQTAFRSTTIPPEILQSLLNLAEFMEHDVEALPISLSILAELAQKGHAYAKALHYRELEFQTNPAGCFESLININKKLDQYDAASGLLKVVKQIQRKFPELKDVYTVQDSWLAKLGHWDEALVKYEQKLALNPKDSSAIAGKMKCLDALGRWEDAIHMCEENLEYLRLESDVIHQKAAVIGARSAWSLNEWNLMGTFVSQVPADNIDGSFMKAVLAVHNENFAESTKNIAHTRKQLDASITALLAESYNRAYPPFIMLQQCSELEEIIEYKMLLRDAGMTDVSSGASRAVGGSVASNSNTSPNASDKPLSVSPLSVATGVGTGGPGGGALNAPIRCVTPNRDGSGLDPRNSSLAGNYMDSTYRGVGTGMHAGIPCTPTRYESISNHLAHDNPEVYNQESLTAARQAKQVEVTRRRAFLAEKWKKRIRGCMVTGRAAIPFWKYLLNGRRMVLSEKEDLDTWLDFVSLCRNGGNSALAERILMMSHHSNHSHSPTNSGGNVATAASGFGSGASSGILDPQDEASIIMDRRIRYAVLKQQWAVGEKQRAMQGLEALIRAGNNDATVGSEDASYLSCLLKLGEWKINMLDPSLPVDKNTRKEVLSLYNRATLVDPHSYMAWHEWGLSNYRAVEESKASHIAAGGKVSTAPTTGFHLSPSILSHQRMAIKNPSKQGTSGAAPLPLEAYANLVINAIKGLMRALTLGTRKCSSSVTQDMLCILSLWFRYGKIPEVCAALESGLSMVHLDNWLGVLPQLIARIDHPDKASRELLHNLLRRLGVKHAEALVYPLSVALKSPKGGRKEAAEALMASLKTHSGKLIDQALLVSQELVRVAILWEELWHWSLEEASRQYFADGNTQGMLDILVPLHQTLEAGPNTLREASFFQSYGSEISDAWDAIKMYMRLMQESNTPIPTTGANKKTTATMKPEDTYLHQAWDLYFNVFKRINAQLPSITSLELQSCSPSLNSALNLDLGVPGTYTVSGSAVRIRSFGPVVSIIRSKQRPRKIRIRGEDGQEYIFLLKGHEDLRQDERAMQLFGLVNALLYHDRRTGTDSQDFSIQRYAIMPLSPTAGLISWVPNCDTLHDLIRSYRESRKIMLDVEHKLILQVAPNKLYDSLPAMHKLEVFEYALAYTAGEDLAKILWLKSENSEYWLQRRATYTRSLAVMSMVGYILGLGDRHPSNLMLDRQTGKVLHIDFGDCFEVAMHREKVPEKVPFRLTRMLVNAMEVAGIEGNYRSTCEKVMSVLRENRDSLVATLEAFVHDPLISWRLLNINKTKPKESTASTGASNPGSAGGADHAHDHSDGSSHLVTPSPIASGGSAAECMKQSGTAATTALAPAPTAATVAVIGGAVAVTGPAKTLTTSTVGIVSGQASEYAAQMESSRQKSGISVFIENSSQSGATTTASESTSTTAASAAGDSQAPLSMDDPLPVDTVPVVTYVNPPGTTGILKASPLITTSSHSTAGNASTAASTSAGAGGASATVSTTTTAHVPSRRLSKGHVSILEPIHEKTRSASRDAQSSVLSGQGGAGAPLTEDDEEDENDDDDDANTDDKAQRPRTPSPEEQRLQQMREDKDTAAMAIINPAAAAAVAANASQQVVSGSVKTVSFSMVNQTIESNNTIRTSSVSMAINHPNTATVNGLDSATVDEAGNVDGLTAAQVAGAMPIHVRSNSISGSSAAAIAGSSSSYRPNLHLEMSSLANSISAMSPSQRHSSSMKSVSVRLIENHPTSSSSVSTAGTDDSDDNVQQELTDKAVVVIRRVMDKLTGLDFQEHCVTCNSATAGANTVVNRHIMAHNHHHHTQHVALEVPEQVERLIKEATSNENLSLSFFGWCPFW